MDERQLTAVVVEDAPLMRRGIRQVLLDAGFALAADVECADQVLDLVAAGETIDVAIVDIRMPPTFTDEGIRLLEQLRAAGSTAGVLLLSMYLDPSYAIRALAHGHRGVGYLLKDRVADLDAFVDCARRVAVGGSAIDPEVIAALARRPSNETSLQRLTQRERDVLRLIAEGRSNRSIAEQLSLTEKTVSTHIAHIFQKLDLEPDDQSHRRVVAVLTWLND
jgi:DNA-binding NarL/FixJ family response regulator